MKSNKILVIENNPAIRFLLQTTLSNFDTIFCSNIESAKKQIKNASLLLVNEGIDTNFDDVSSDKIITIKKPFDPTSLSKKVNRILNQKNVSKTSKQYLSSKDISKRIFDIIFASTILIISLPIFVLISILIKLESEGAIFYVSKRAGRGYRVFKFLKFRTMRVGSNRQIFNLLHLNQYQDGPQFIKIDNDPRITKLGKFLRNTSLDELPQLINVLLGDMTIVGNRPLPLYEAKNLTTDQFAKRFMAPAGITGLWQVKKRGQKNMSAKERIDLDIDYSEKYSIKYDIWILVNTTAAMLQKTSS